MFADRAHAGRMLAAELLPRQWPKPVVLALPRGGVPVAVEVALALDAPLDLVIVRRIGAQASPELAVAAVAEGGGEPVLDAEAMEASGTYRAHVEVRARAERAEALRRRALYAGKSPPMDLRGRTAIVVDDGVATGTSARAALKAVRARGPERLILAVPVASRQGASAVMAEADGFVCLEQPAFLRAVGVHYADFHPLSDEQVLAALARVRDRRRSAR